MRPTSGWVAPVVVMLVVTRTACGSPFATRVVSFDPAPGQFVNNGAFNVSGRALGPPSGGGVFAADNGSIVSLGGFGGSITLAFDHRVEDHPLNPLGLDATVFGNAFWLGTNAQTHYAECGVIEISVDANGNGEADDPWYLIPGSHLGPDIFPTHVQTWDNDILDATWPPSFAAWLPNGAVGVFGTETFLLPPKVFARFVLRNPLYPLEREGVFGYADYSPTLVLGDLDGDGIVDDATMSAETFYTVPDDPLTVGVDFGSGGGDAFDIAWALDPTTGAPANLSGFDFIRISNPVHFVQLPLGELSPEIDAVADVSPDLTGDADRDEDIDLVDAAAVQVCIGQAVGAQEVCDHLALRDDQWIEVETALALLRRMTGPR